jgi:predicted phage replisome organizer/uncharacterized phage protein (TIGR02220 family)
MSKVKWIKITTDIFNDEKIQLIESIPDSDTIIVIWFKLLTLAGKSNNGGLVMISETVPYTIDMLVTLFRRKKLVVELALKTFQMYGMIEILDNETILIRNWEKHQNVKGLDVIKEQNKIRQQRYRDNQKKLVLEEKKKEKQEKEELDIDIEGNATNNVTFPYKIIIDYLNTKASRNFRNVDSNKKFIKARFNEGYVLEDFKNVIDSKCKEWLKTKYETYLQPSTLFGTKFDNYLNGVEKNDNGKEVIPDAMASFYEGIRSE